MSRTLEDNEEAEIFDLPSTNSKFSLLKFLSTFKNRLDLESTTTILGLLVQPQKHHLGRLRGSPSLAPLPSCSNTLR